MKSFRDRQTWHRLALFRVHVESVEPGKLGGIVVISERIPQNGGTSAFAGGFNVIRPVYSPVLEAK
jgi:hypothetical protein